MFRLLLKKYLHDAALLWIASAVMLLIFPWVRIWTISQFELSGFAPLMDQIRAFEKFSPVPLEQFLTYEGVIALTYDEPILILCVLVWSISRGTDVVSGELGRGTMEMLLAQPVSRLQVFWAHAMVSIAGLCSLVAVAHLGLCLGLATNSVAITIEPPRVQIPGLPFSLRNPFGGPGEKVMQPLTELVSYDLYWIPSLHLLGLGLAVLGLSVLMSSFDQYRWRSIGLVLGVYVLQLLLYILAKSTPRLGSLKGFSFLAAYQPDWSVQMIKRDASAAYALTYLDGERWGVGPLGFALLLISMGAVLHVVACWLFLKRDLPAPL